MELIGHESEVIAGRDRKLVSTERVEAILTQSQFVDQLFVHMDSEETMEAIVFPNINMIKVWCCEHGIKGSFPDLCANKVMQGLMR